MGPPSATATIGRVLIGRTGDERAFEDLRYRLIERGFDTELMRAPLLGAHSTADAADDLLREIDVALLAVRQADGEGEVGPVRPLQSLVREAGVIQGKLSVDRVILLVENTVDGLADPGLAVIRYPPGRVDAVADEVASRLRAVMPSHISPPPPPPPPPTPPPPEAPSAGDGSDPAYTSSVHGRLWHVEQRRWGDSVVPVLGFIGIVVLVALIGALLLLARGSGGDEVATDDDGETVQLLDVAGNLVIDDGFAAVEANASAAASGSGDPAGASATDPATDSAGAGSSASGDALGGSSSSGDAITLDPSGPSATSLTADLLLPATCLVDLTKNTLLDDGALVCDLGHLHLEGPVGPWHNEVAAIATSEGVSGRAIYERNGASADIGGGTVRLDPVEADYGVAALSVIFSSDGEHVHLLSDPDWGEGFATLTFTLDG